MVNYAVLSKRYLDEIGELVEDAWMLCRDAGRDRITFKDLVRARTEIRGPSDASLMRVIEEQPNPRRQGTRQQVFSGSEQGLQDGLNGDSTSLPVPDTDQNLVAPRGRDHSLARRHGAELKTG